MCLSAIVATVPVVAHAYMLFARVVRTIVAMMIAIIAVTTVHVPAVTTTIGCVEVGTTEVEEVTVWIVDIYSEVPVTGFPVQGTEEICGCTIQIPLPSVEDILQIHVATLPAGAINIVATGYTHQVVQVYLVGGFILLVGEVQLISHFIGQEKSLGACTFV
jgi:hypothetical protein